MDITDELLISYIRSGDSRKRSWALYQFYGDPAIRAWTLGFVSRYGGQKVDEEDVFQNAMVIFDRDIRSGKFQGASKLKTFLSGIFKLSWVGYKRKRNPTFELKREDIDSHMDSVEQEYLKKERKELLEGAIAKLGPACQQVLYYYKLSYSMKEIMNKLDMPSEGSAKKKTHSCREKLRKYLSDNSGLSQALNLDI